MGKNKRTAKHHEAGKGWSGLKGMGAAGIAGLISCGVALLVSWLFYDSLWGLVTVFVIYIPVLKIYRDEESGRRESQLVSDLKELLQQINSYLQAGYSLENAFMTSGKVLIQLLGRDNELCLRIGQMNQKVAVNMPVEQAFKQLAEEVDLEEYREFSEIISIAKRLGGNYNKHIRRTAVKIEERIEVEQEIETMMAEKKLEMRIMVIMPLAIISYVKLSSPDFIEDLYHNALGVVIMTGCLVIYMLMIMLGRRIVEIKV